MTNRSEPSAAGGDLTFLSVLAALPVSEGVESIDWYSRFLDRSPDMEPVEGVAEWVLAQGATLQLVTRPESAGTGFTRLEVADLDQAVEALERRGFHPANVGQIDGIVRYADYLDPSGNELSVVQALFEVTRFPASAPAG